MSVKNKDGFLCNSCRDGMCDDCVNIADEYAELLQLRTNALMVANHKVETLTEELKALKRKAAIWEKLSKMGMPEIITKWMDSQAATPQVLPEAGAKSRDWTPWDQ